MYESDRKNMKIIFYVCVQIQEINFFSFVNGWRDEQFINFNIHQNIDEIRCYHYALHIIMYVCINNPLVRYHLPMKWIDIIARNSIIPKSHQIPTYSCDINFYYRHDSIIHIPLLLSYWCKSMVVRSWAIRAIKQLPKIRNKILLHSLVARIVVRWRYAYSSNYRTW